MKIGISAQVGGPKSAKAFSKLHVQLNSVFKKHIKGFYFKTIEKFSVVFRVSGSIQDFGSEGPELMKYLRKRNVITIDLTFPETSWKGVEENVVHANILEGVAECIRLMTERAIKEKEVLDLEGFQTDVKKALDECRLPA